MSAATDEILEKLKTLSLLEASELVSQIEEAFGVSAAAPVGGMMMAAGSGRSFPSVESAGYAQPHRRETSALLVPGEPGEHYITPSYLCSAGILITCACCRRVYPLMELLYYMSTRYAVGVSPATTE